MSYSGFLVKVGTYEVPAKYIKANTFKAKINKQDLNAYTDGNGQTHRNTLTYIKPTVQWDVPTPITETEFRKLMNGIQGQYTKEKERAANITAFYPETGETKTISMYMSDPEITIDYAAYKSGTDLTYSSISLKWTAYGGTFS